MFEVVSDGCCVAALLHTFDAERLRACLSALRSFACGAQPWEAHGGTWWGIALVTNAGRVESARASRAGEEEPHATTALAAAPYLREVLRVVPGRVVFARLMSLDPGGHVPEHRDAWHSLGTGFVRLQLAIDVGAESGLRIAGHDICVRDGELWYTDVSQTHSVTNASTRARVNVLVDIETTEAFVEAMGPRIRREDVFVARRACVTPADLLRFECSVVVPSEVSALMGGAGPASIRVEDGSPWLRFDDGLRVLLRAESRDVLNVVGLPPGLAIRRSDGPRAPAMQFVLRGGSYGCNVEPGHAFDLSA